ncbi:MAG: LysR family transcriptional regulator [Parvularculaceae bacterium]|nr:LysR family transcriptional regulator [Parvularculaceae bacterium]
MEMHQVRYFIALARALNFTRAADECHVSQPALTKAIKLLEEELGGALVNRRIRPMRLTPLGENLRDRFAAIFDIALEIKAEAAHLARRVCEQEAIGLVSTLGAARASAIAARMREEFPDIALLVRHAAQPDLVSALADGEIDYAIIADCDGEDQRFDYRPLFTERYFLATTPAAAARMNGAVSLGELSGIDYVHRAHCELNDRTDRILREKGVEMESRFSTDQDETAKQMIAAGLGVAILPESYFDGSLGKCEIRDENLSRTISLARLKSRARGAADERLFASLEKFFCGQAR